MRYCESTGGHTALLTGAGSEDEAEGDSGAKRRVILREGRRVPATDAAESEEKVRPPPVRPC